MNNSDETVVNKLWYKIHDIIYPDYRYCKNCGVTFKAIYTEKYIIPLCSYTCMQAYLIKNE